MVINQIKSKLSSREASCREITQEFLNVAREKNGEIRAYLELNEDLALNQADAIDSKIENGESVGELGGVPMAIKDNILTRGFKCTAGSKILENYEAPYDATAVHKLRDAGAIILGKTNLDEFAMGSSTENSAFGPTKNPLDVSRVPGGSSGGSAAAVADGMCAGSLGSDTGGSVRQPAAFCGVVGFKPTYGAISRYGLISMASSLDQIGPIANTVEDVKTIFSVIQGRSKFDATSLDPNSGTGDFRPDKLTIGIPNEYFGQGIDPAVKEAVEKAIEKYEQNGGRIKEISLPHTEYGLAVYHIIMPSEVSSNLARYDGMRYGVSTDKCEISDLDSALAQAYMCSRMMGFGKEVRRRIILGTYTLSSGYYDAYYLRAQKVRALIKQEFEKAFFEVDVIMTPATPTPPFKFGEKAQDPVSMYLSDMFTVNANLAGLPAVTVPCGWTERDGSKLPVSFQVIGPQKEDFKVLGVAGMYEKF